MSQYQIEGFLVSNSVDVGSGDQRFQKVLLANRDLDVLNLTTLPGSAADDEGVAGVADN